MGIDLGTGLQLGATALNAIKGIGTLFGGKSDEEKAREELSRLKTPFYQIQNEYIQNRNIAANMAGSGLPDATKNYYTNEAQRGLGTTIGALNQSGGLDPNQAGRLMDVYNQSINKVAMEDAQMQVQNIQNFFNTNKELAGQKTMKWTIDEYAPYERKLKEINNRIAAAKQNQNTGMNDVIGSVSAAGTAISNNDLMSKLFGNKSNEKRSNETAPINQVPNLMQGKTAINPVQLPNLGQSNIASQPDIYNPSVNPFEANGGGYWDGNQWTP